MKKTRGRKSRDTVPLTKHKGLNKVPLKIVVGLQTIFLKTEAKMYKKKVDKKSTFTGSTTAHMS
jgi:hypothetical protein